MRKLLLLFLVIFMISCNGNDKTKIPVYAWESGPGKLSDKELLVKFKDYNSKGIDGLMYSAGQDPETYRRVGAIAKEAGLEFYAWIPTMVQGGDKLDHSLYAINGNGESAWDKPAYVDYYKFLCPNLSAVQFFLIELYSTIADVPEVDGIHLDYIRFPDVILARGLWEKYDLVMDREYPQFDYCYCDTCVADFKELTGIDILEADDPSQVDEWKQFRYDLITDLVNTLADVVHAKDKEISAAVFPGPNSIAKKIVRQEWDKWNIDAFYPMNYNDFYLEGTEWIGEMCLEGVTAIQNRKPLYSGLFICPSPEKKSNEADPEGHGLIPEELEAAINESMDNGAAGICLFTPGRMTDKDWVVFKKAIYK